MPLEGPFGGGGGGGSGFSLGPAQNVFGVAATANRAAAEALRNIYAAANDPWLDAYNEDRANWIQLVWTGGAYVIQRRNLAETAWEDVTNVIIGGRGSSGVNGQNGLGLREGTPAETDAAVQGTEYEEEHGLGAAPDFVIMEAECTTAEEGYAVGDTVFLNSDKDRMAIWSNDTHVGFVLHENRGLPLIIDRSGASFGTFSLTAGSWTIRAIPYISVGGQTGQGVSEQRVQELIDATSLSALQGQLVDGQIPSLIMRDAEFTAAAIRNLLNLSAQEVNDLLTGAVINGQTITFTQNDGTNIPLTIPSGTGGMADGVVESGAVNAAGTELILTLDTGGTVTIDIPAILRTGQGSALAWRDEGADLGAVTSVDIRGDNVVGTNVNGVLTIVISGSGTPATHTEQFLAGKATQDFGPGDFVGALGVAYVAGSHTATLPDVGADPVFAAVARISTDPEPSYADVNSQGINAFTDFTKQANEIAINGDMYEVWVSDYAIFVTGDRVEWR